MSHLFLLGAGASYEAAVPTAVPMTSAIREVLERRNAPAEVVQAYDFVTEFLVGHQGGLSPNVEVVYQAIEALAHRTTSPPGIFATTWLPEIEQIDEEGTVFLRTADCMRQALVDLTYIENPRRVDYYVPLIAASVKRGLPIFTLNYDNAVELACAELGIRVDHGLGAWRKAGEISFAEGALPLVKLHGSITWASQPDPHYGPMLFIDFADPQPHLESLRSGETLPYVVFGAMNKLTAETFMLDQLAEFSRRLTPDAELHVIGYGFGDEHVNHIIAGWRERGGMLHIYDLRSEADLRQYLAFVPRGVDILSYGGAADVPDVMVHGDTPASSSFEKIHAELG